MDTLQLQQRVKFAEYVWHEQPYLHPQLKTSQPKDFYGRQNAIQKAKTTIRSSLRPVIFIGERRAGKTSIFKLMMHFLRSEADFLPIEISWLEVHSAAELMQQVLFSLIGSLDLTEDAMLDAAAKIHSSAEFRSILQRILEKTEKMVVLGIDEFDTLLFEQPEEGRKRIIGTVISLVEMDEYPIRTILSMAREPAQIETGYASPLTTKSEKIRLGPFSKAEMDEMLLGILGDEIVISEQEKMEIYTLSGGWPYFAKALLYYWLEMAGQENAVILAAEKASCDASLSDTMEHIYLKHFSPLEQTVLLTLAKLGGTICAKEKSALDISIQTAAQGLIKRGYVIEKEGGYGFRVILMKRWFVSWPRFEEQVSQHAAEALISIERQKDPWAGIKQDDIFNGVGDDDV